MDSIYNRISELCHARGVNITVMCQKAGMARAIMTDFKMGRTKKLSTDTLQKIADYFDVTVDYLLTGEQEKAPAQGEGGDLTEYLEELRTRPEMKMLFALTKGATKEQVQKSAKIIEAYLKSESDE